MAITATSNKGPAPAMSTHRLLDLAILSIPFVCSSSLSNAFETPKWLMAGVIVGVMLLLQAFRQKAPMTPVIPRRASIACLLVVTLQLVGIFFLNPPVWQDYLFYLVVFFGFIFFFFQDLTDSGLAVLEHYARPMLIGTVAVSFVGLIQLAGFEPLRDALGRNFNEHYASTFGNVNYVGQYLGICILFFILAMARTTSAAWRVSFFAGVVFALTYFSFINTRSVILGLSIAVSWLLWRGNILSRKRFLQLLLASSICIPLSHYAISAIPRPLVSKDRIESASIRLGMWQGTLRMIADHPFGVGIDNFNFSFVPYRTKIDLPVKDADSISSPHNEFLAITAESGIPVAMIIFVLAYFLLVSFLQKNAQSSLDKGYFEFIVSLFIFFASEAFFQFPFDGQWALIIFCLLLAVILYSTYSARELPNQWTKRVSLYTGIFALYSAMTWFFAAGALFDSFDVNKAKFACEERPQDWFTCHRYAQALFKAGDALKAEQVLQDELLKQPNNWFAKGLLGQIYIDTGRQQEGCDLYRQIDLIFNGKSRVHDLVLQRCN